MPGKAMLFVDIENMGSRAAYDHISQAIEKYDPARMEAIYATMSKKSFPTYYKSSSLPWVFVKSPFRGKNAADCEMFLRIREVIAEKDIETIILATSDSDFLPICREILNRKKNLYLISYESSLKCLISPLKSCKNDLFSFNLIINPHAKSRSIPRKKPSNKSKKIRYIPLVSNDLYFEIPFHDGIYLYDFLANLDTYGLHALTWKTRLYEIGLEIRWINQKNPYVYRMPQEKIDYINYWKSATKHTIFIESYLNEELIEVPFVNGISYLEFQKLLLSMGVIRREQRKTFPSFLQRMFLEIRDSCIYIASEQTILSDFSLFFCLTYHPKRKAFRRAYGINRSAIKSSLALRRRNG